MGNYFLPVLYVAQIATTYITGFAGRGTSL